MSSDYYGFIAGEIADEGAADPPRDPVVCGVGYCEDGWHECGGYCGSCGIHLDQHGIRCGTYAGDDLPGEEE